MARRLAELARDVGDEVARDVRGLVAGGASGSVIAAGDAEELRHRHGLTSARELALLALPVAREMASPPISGYRVAAVGIESSGDLALGANLEFPGTDLGTTIHAEGFVALRARRRGHALAVLAVQRARPCAHCRQTLAESAGADGLELVDLDGHAVGLDDLYPWAFRPGALGVAGDAAAETWPDLRLADEAVAMDAAGPLVDAGRRAHAPYSGAPSAVALRLGGGSIVSAGCVESVAFNPTITALQAALVEVAAVHAEPAAIVEAWLARSEGAVVDPGPVFLATLAAVAPKARATVVDWVPEGGRT